MILLSESLYLFRLLVALHFPLNESNIFLDVTPPCFFISTLHVLSRYRSESGRNRLVYLSYFTSASILLRRVVLKNIANASTENMVLFSGYVTRLLIDAIEVGRRVKTSIRRQRALSSFAIVVLTGVAIVLDLFFERKRVVFADNQWLILLKPTECSSFLFDFLRFKVPEPENLRLIRFAWRHMPTDCRERTECLDLKRKRFK